MLSRKALFATIRSGAIIATLDGHLDIGHQEAFYVPGSSLYRPRDERVALVGGVAGGCGNDAGGKEGAQFLGVAERHHAGR